MLMISAHFDDVRMENGDPLSSDYGMKLTLKYIHSTVGNFAVVCPQAINRLSYSQASKGSV